MSDTIETPGDAIKAELDKRGWTQADFAQIIGRDLPAVSLIINGKRSITPDMAVSFAAALGHEPEYWLNLDGRFRLSLLEPDAEVERRAKIYSLAPVKEMEKRGWIKPTETIGDLEKELCRFYGVSSLDSEPAFEAVARKSTPSKPLTATQRAWCVRGARMAAAVKVEKFKPAVFAKELPGLRNLAAHPEQVREIPKALGSLGVRLVVVEPLSKAKIDGAAFWLDDESPVIVLSVRFDRIDGLWHTLAHELRHVLHHDLASVDSEIFGENKESQTEEIEVRAEREAAEFLVPETMLQSFILRVKPLYSKTRIIQFANRAKIHPGIVTGQLQHRHEIPYSANREMLVRVRDLLTSSALADGWGHTVPAI